MQTPDKTSRGNENVCLPVAMMRPAPALGLSSTSTRVHSIFRMAEPISIRLYSRPVLTLSFLADRTPSGDGEGGSKNTNERPR
jgi:hypothetical protein